MGLSRLGTVRAKRFSHLTIRYTLARPGPTTGGDSTRKMSLIFFSDKLIGNRPR